MEKISITVAIPALRAQYNFIVPDNMVVRDAQQLIVRILSSEYGVPETHTGLMLIDMEDQKVLKQDHSFSQLGIANGSQLLMV